MRCKQLVCSLVLTSLDSPQLGTTSKQTIYKTVNYCSRDLFNFDFLEKGLEIISPAQFAYGFSRKMFLIL